MHAVGRTARRPEAMDLDLPGATFIRAHNYRPPRVPERMRRRVFSWRNPTTQNAMCVQCGLGWTAEDGTYETQRAPFWIPRMSGCM